MVTDMPPLDFQAAMKATRIQQEIDPNRYGNILLGRELE